MKLTKRQEILVNEAFNHFDAVCYGTQLELDGYGFNECNVNTLKALQSRGFIETYTKHDFGYTIVWLSDALNKWAESNGKMPTLR